MQDVSLTLDQHQDGWKPGERILLINPPVVDLRVPWPEWVEPTGLLKLGTFLQQQGRDVRLFDAFHAAPQQRERDALLNHEGQPLSRWRFGLRAPQIRRQLGAMIAEDWMPDDIVITSLTSFWWRGAAFMQSVVRPIFPQARIILGGAYPTAAPEHAAIHSGADVLLSGPLPDEVLRCTPAYVLYPGRRKTCALSDIALTGIEGTLATVAAGVTKGVTRLHLADQGLATAYPDLLATLLERLVGVHPRTRLFVLGTISAKEIAGWPALPKLLRAARCRQINLADNRTYPPGPGGNEAFLAEVATATPLIHAAGFRPRTKDYAVGLAIGRPGEPPPEVAGTVARLAHMAGSIVPIPYQLELGQLEDRALGEPIDPWETNGKLFPLAARNGGSFMEYMEVLGLCAVANAKYRTRTFDFSAADSLVARSLRRALANRSWDPYQEAASAQPEMATVAGEPQRSTEQQRTPRIVLPILAGIRTEAVRQGADSA